MQYYFVEIQHDKGTDYLKTTAGSRESLLEYLPNTLNCPRSAITKAVEVGYHEFEKFPANTIKTSSGLFKLLIDKVNGKYGAPMGRSNVYPEKVPNTNAFYTGGTFDRRITLDSGGYDAGGAYWGRGTELRVEYNKELTYVRYYRK